MRQHSHSHAGGRCESEAAGTGFRRRSPSPAARYAPIPTAEELTAMGEALQNQRSEACPLPPPLLITRYPSCTTIAPRPTSGTVRRIP
jgi:hypothetical protein